MGLKICSKSGQIVLDLCGQVVHTSLDPPQGGWPATSDPPHEASPTLGVGERGSDGPT